MKTSMKTLSVGAVLVLLGSTGWAKLPTPAPSDEAKAQAAQAAAKKAWAGKVDAFKLCKAQDKVVAHYKKMPVAKDVKGAAKATGASSSCADPGPFVYAPNTAVSPAAKAPAAPAVVAQEKKP